VLHALLQKLADAVVTYIKYQVLLQYCLCCIPHPEQLAGQAGTGDGT
jgi:hypothetical protein